MKLLKRNLKYSTIKTDEKIVVEKDAFETCSMWIELWIKCLDTQYRPGIILKQASFHLKDSLTSEILDFNKIEQNSIKFNQIICLD
jgi:hypothetical protein